MALHTITTSASGNIVLSLETQPPSSGPWHTITNIICDNTASGPCTFRLYHAASNRLIRQETFPNGGTTTVPVTDAQVRLNADGTLDLSGYRIDYTGPSS